LRYVKTLFFFSFFHTYIGCKIQNTARFGGESALYKNPHLFFERFESASAEILRYVKTLFFSFFFYTDIGCKTPNTATTPAPTTTTIATTTTTTSEELNNINICGSPTYGSGGATLMGLKQGQAILILTLVGCVVFGVLSRGAL
jgi:hypothetical protein